MAKTEPVLLDLEDLERKILDSTSSRDYSVSPNFSVSSRIAENRGSDRAREGRTAGLHVYRSGVVGILRNPRPMPTS